MSLVLPPLRLLHTSDVHLGAFDSPGAEEVREQHHAAFRRVVDIGIEQEVDLVLIAGDFFDHARVSEDTLTFARVQLDRLGIPVVIGPGNHDHVGPGSVYDRLEGLPGGSETRVIRDTRGETITLPALGVDVWGRAHDETSSRFRPFTEPPPRGDAPWQLAIGHGHYIHPDALLSHSFHIREEDLVAADRDYVALGHWERMTRVAAGDRSVAAYSGAPRSVSPHNGGYVLIVDLDETRTVRVKAAPVAADRQELRHDELPLLRGGEC